MHHYDLAGCLLNFTALHTTLTFGTADIYDLIRKYLSSWKPICGTRVSASAVQKPLSPLSAGILNHSKIILCAGNTELGNRHSGAAFPGVSIGRIFLEGDFFFF